MMITFFLVLLKIYYDINRLKATFKTNFVYTSIIYAVIIAILIVKAKSNHLEQKDSTGISDIFL